MEPHFHGDAASVGGYAGLSWGTAHAVGEPICHRHFSDNNRATVLVDQASFIDDVNGAILQTTPEAGPVLVAISNTIIRDNKAVGLQLAGSIDLLVRDSEISRNGAPSLIVSGAGTVRLDAVKFSGGYSGIILQGNDAPPGIRATLRGVEVNGADYYGVWIMGGVGNAFDLGVVGSPGGNAFWGNNHSGPTGIANLVYVVAENVIVYAVGNTWDPGVQGADENGRYLVDGAGATLDVSSGEGPNYWSEPSNAGILRLAENPL